MIQFSENVIRFLVPTCHNLAFDRSGLNELIRLKSYSHWSYDLMLKISPRYLWIESKIGLVWSVLTSLTMELAEKAGLIYQDTNPETSLTTGTKTSEGFPETDSPVWILGRERSAKYGRPCQLSMRYEWCQCWEYHYQLPTRILPLVEFCQRAKLKYLKYLKHKSPSYELASQMWVN